MEALIITTSIAAVCFVLGMFIANKMKTRRSQMGVPSVKPLHPPPPMPGQSNAEWLEGRIPPPPPIKRQRNQRGWRAPAGHYFDDDDRLFNDDGNLILDILMVAQLCGEQYEATEEAAPVIEAVGSENISSPPVEAEVSSKTDFSDLETKSPPPAPSYSAPEPSYGGGGDTASYDSGGDSGGGDSGGGGD